MDIPENSFFDFHTHNLQAQPGTAIVNLPEAALRCPAVFVLTPGALYSAGIHPWWTPVADEELWAGWEYWLRHPQVVAVGECGLDRMRGGDLLLQEEVFMRQAEKAEELHLPVTVHCVRAFDRLLALRRRLRPQVRWTVHGFRGKPALALQLLQAGMDLSFGGRYCAESYALTPPDRRHRETDDD